MASSNYFILIVSLVCSFQAVFSSQVPVFMWGDLKSDIRKSNPLAPVKEEDFNNIIENQLSSKPFTVIFIEETLSVEDLSGKNENGQTPYPYLQSNVGKSIYLPSVESPVDSLQKLLDTDDVDRIKLTENGLSAEIQSDSVRILFLNLEDARVGESRISLLRRHNDFIEATFTKLREKYGKVLGIYTASYPSWTVPDELKRVRRQTLESTISYYNASGNMLFYAKNITLENNGNIEYLANAIVDYSVNDTSIDITMKFGTRSVVLYFTTDSSYWFLNKVAVSDVEDPLLSETVYAVNGYSYACAQDTEFTSLNRSKSERLIFTGLQIQPFFRDNTTAAHFGEAFNCVGLFTVPIWSGLFIVFVLLIITMWGIMMIMDINTMDRFDDAKGKTISINVTD